MTRHHSSFAAAALGMFAALAVQTASAQTPAAANCDGVQQDKAACVREAGAARQEATRGGLTSTSPGGKEVNSLERCQQLPASDKADCEARVRGAANSSTSGSVMGGGVIRETVTPVPAPSTK